MTDPKQRALHGCAADKYRKQYTGFCALGIGCFPFVVETLGRLHDDALRTLWHLAGRQIDWITSDTEGKQVAGIFVTTSYTPSAEKVPGAFQPKVDTTIRSRGAQSSCDKQRVFHDPDIGTGFDLGGG